MLWYANDCYKELLTNMQIHNIFQLQFHCGKGELVSASSTSKVWRQKWLEQYVYFKQYFYPHSLRFLFRDSKAKREWISYQFFCKLGIPCPDVICCAEERYWGRLKSAIIVTKSIPNTANLMELFQSQQTQTRTKDIILSNETRQEIIIELAKHISNLHCHHFCHYDLKLRNILWQQSASSHNTLYFIDCPRGHPIHFFVSHAIFKDLKDMYRYASLFWTYEECQIFWKHYCQDVKLDCNPIWSRLQKIVAKK